METFARPVRYFRVYAGPKNAFARRCLDEGFIGGDWGFDYDLGPHLPDNWKAFGKAKIPEFLDRNPSASKVTAGLACGMLHTLCKMAAEGDVVLTPEGAAGYRVGRIVSPYVFAPGDVLPHRRKVEWAPRLLDRSELTGELRRSLSSGGMVCDVTRYGPELSVLLNLAPPPVVPGTDEVIEDVVAFALERHLEDFLVTNWAKTDLGRDFDIYAVDGEIVGRQYPTDTGPIDILAVSKDGATLLVVELKRGRASDAVVGQIQRYMGYVASEIAKPEQSVKGCIVAYEDDVRIRRALTVARDIDFFRYAVTFRLSPVAIRKA
mgnify:FL=1|jgi:Predicted nuclease of the RecB family